MNSIKILFVFNLLLFGSFAQRYQRHLFDGTQNGLIPENSEIDNSDSLASDDEIYVPDGDDLKFVRDGREVELELAYNKLMFKFCSRGCMGITVTACYDSINPNPEVRGKCGAGQCEFNASVVKQGGLTYLRFMTTGYHEISNNNDNVCGTATMASPKAIISLEAPAVESCEPLFIDGKVIKLIVLGATHSCSLYVINAKKWVPPPPTTPTKQNSSVVPNQTTSKSSEANTTLWIGIGCGIFILLIVVIGFGYCCYRTQIRKKPLFGKQKDIQPNEIIPEASKKANVVKEKAGDEKEVVEKPETTKEEAVAKEEIADEKQVLKPKEVVAKPEPTKEKNVAKEKQQKPAKKTAQKETKAPVVVPKPSKEVTRENETKEDAPPAKKVLVEPTLENPTTEASVVQKSVVQQKQQRPEDPPRVFVPDKVILPAPKSVNAPKSGSLSGKKDSLSGRHEIGMQGMAESASRSLERHDLDDMLKGKTKEKLKKFYPPGPVSVFDPREIELLCCARISIMFKTIEMLIDDAIKVLIEHGVTFDEKSNIVEMSPKAEKYLQQKTTPEYVRAFAFGNVFREQIDSQARVHKTFSIPLLWTIVLQRRYTVFNRRKLSTWIRRQLLIIQEEFSAKERSELRYPICAIEEACKMDADGFKSILLLNTRSGAEDDEKQNSTRAS